MLTALVLRGKYWLGGAEAMDFNPQALIYLVLAAGAMGFGYAAWNVGQRHGNVTLLTGASYFIPTFSAALSALLLRTPLALSFWQGRAGHGHALHGLDPVLVRHSRQGLRAEIGERLNRCDGEEEGGAIR